ncbi:MAG TPA: KUP/HAK/KT family potassium transporter, partial [Burkholderiaceae bacterium]|nr:KUP/HAK/KT family potassium transporter [Burkholderiaceae bacterium]
MNTSLQPSSPASPAPVAPPATDPAPAGHAHSAGLASLMLAAIGVVYGDIGTSPLYTVKEIFLP